MTRASLTVTADAKAKIYGAANPALTVTLTGFVNGDTLATSDVTGAAAITTAATTATAAGPAAITPALGTLASTNYAFGPFTAGVLTITPAPLTVTGVTASDKIYDATATATPVFTAATLNGLVAGDSANVTLVTTAATAAFADKIVAAAKPVAIAGLTLGGTAAGNYTLAQPTGVTAAITPKTITATGIAATDKIYDATTAATLTTSAAAPAGVIAGDTVALNSATATGTFSGKNAGVAKTVAIAGLVLTGSDAANYTLTPPTATATVTAKTVTVSGVAGVNKIYDTTTTAALNFTAAILVGVVSGDTVALNSAGASGAFASATVGTARPVAIAGLTLAGADAANYALTPPSTTAAITPATATVTLGALTQTYTGATRVATATTVPAGLTVNLTYAGAATAPTAAGSYAVVGTISDPNYQGTATGTLTIARADQTVYFAAIGATTVGVAVALSADTSSGLPVTFSVVSGDATISGATLTMNASTAAIIRATQSGDANFNAASADQVVASAGKLDQTITFAALADRPAAAPSFALSASATSGLPVTFTVMSGPALLAAGAITLTGAPGEITVRATQAGDAVYHAAAAVTRTFTVTPVGPLIFFGNLGNDPAPFAAEVSQDGKSGTMIGVIPGAGEGFVVNFTIGASGDWSATGTTFSAPSANASDAPRGSSPSALTIGAGDDELPGAQALATGTRTFRGRVNGAAFTGSIDGVNVPFTATLSPPAGPTAAIAGYYQSSSVQTATGSIYSIVGATNQVYVLAVTPGYVGGNTGTATANGAYTVETSPAVMVAGAVDAPTTAVTGTIKQPNKPDESFAGLVVTTLRTDRMLNLSSRSRIETGGSQLIAGFVIGGSEPKTVLLRAVGPSLTPFGIGDALPATRLRLYDGQGRLLREVDGWSGDAATSAAFGQVGAFGLSAANNDSALLITLSPGAYTMHIVPKPDAKGITPTVAGVALAEIYDASVNPRAEYQRLVNISTRGTVLPGDGVLIGGFVITGNSPKRVLVRGVGPALAAFGVGDALTDPTLTLYSGSTIIARNDNWATPVAINSTQAVATATEIAAATQAVGGFPLAGGSRDAAVIVTLAPGAYTAQIAGVANATGTALIEIYEISE